MSKLEFDVTDLDTPIVLRRPGWGDFAAWLDSFLTGQTGDAQHNLSTGCAVSPGAGELAAIFADGFGFLPGDLSNALLEAAGLPGGMSGLGEVYALVGAGEAESKGVPREMIEAARKRTRRHFFALTPAGWWACKAPGTAEASAYEDAITAAVQGRGSRAGALRALTLSCVLSPDPEVAKAQIEETPAIPYMLARALREAAGEGKAVARVKG